MQKRLTILAAAAALTVSGMGYTVAQQTGSSASGANPPSGQSSGQTQSGQYQPGQPTGTAGQTPGSTLGSASDTSRGQQSPDAKEITRVLSQTTAAAVQGKFDDVLERFTSADRQRLKDQFKQNDQQVAQRWDQFKNDWKAKYNQDFDSSNAVTAFNNGQGIQILSGDISDSARLAGQRMSPSGSMSSGSSVTGDTTGTAGTSGSTSGTAGGATGASSGTSGAGVSGSIGGSSTGGGVSGSANVGGAGVSGSAGASGTGAGVSGSAGTSGTSSGTTGGSAGGTGATGGASIGSSGATASGTAGSSSGAYDRTTGSNTTGSNATGGTGTASNDQSRRVNQNMATVMLPASHGLPEVTLHLSNEGTLADRWKIDVPDTLTAQQLRSNLEQQLTQLGDKNSWPGDVNDAYQMVTHHVLMAIAQPQSDMNGRNDRTGQLNPGGTSNTGSTSPNPTGSSNTPGTTGGR